MKRTDQCSLPDTQSTLQHLWGVMLDKDAAEQVERQLILLHTYLSVTGPTVWLQDLRLLSRVLTFLMVKAELQTSYREPLHAILDLLQHPFKMEIASDEINFKEDLTIFFTNLGRMVLSSKNKEIQSKLLKIIEGTLFTKRVGCSDSVPIRSYISAFEASSFMECFADFITVSDGDLYLWALYLALKICVKSRLSCWTLVTRGMIDCLLIRLTTAHVEQKSEVLDISHQLLWYLLDCTCHTQEWTSVPLPSLLALRSLRYVLREEAITHAHPGHYSNSLNNISVLTLKLMHVFPHADYVLSGLTEDITFLATLTESVIPIHIIPHFKNTLDHLQFKKFMLACLSLSPISSLSITTFEQFKVADCLVAIISGNTLSGSPVSWTPEQQLELFQCALPVICSLFDHIHMSFIDAGLMQKLLMFLTVHYFDEKHIPDDLALTVIATISSLCFRKVNNKSIRCALKKANAISTIIDLCKIIIERNIPLTTRTQSFLCHSLIVLALLLENEEELQVHHCEMSTKIVNTLYARILTPLPNDSLMGNKLMVSVSNFAWEALILNEKSYYLFLKSGNVLSHIDILEKSPFSIQLIYLSVLVDLSEYDQCVPYLVSWRGREGVKLLSLLCRIWRAEEDRLLVPRTKNGLVSDIEKPLMGEKQSKLIKTQEKKSVSAYDLFGSARPKIYAIVQLLRRHKDVKEICEEHYRLGHDKLPYEDRITMKVIEAYLPLKLGEIWWEIRNKQENVLPLDKYLAETLADRYLNWSLSVQHSQFEILNTFEQRSLDEEREFYSLLHGDHLTSALAALREVELIARTADRQQNLRVNQRLLEGIKLSRTIEEKDLRITYPHGLSVSLVSSQLDMVLRNEPPIGRSKSSLVSQWQRKMS